VIERAILWCQGLLALPDQAMSATRKEARTDLVDYFDRSTERELQGVADSWWSPQTQSVLRELTAKLGKKVTTA